MRVDLPMRYRSLHNLHLVVASVLFVCCCTVPNPNYRPKTCAPNQPLRCDGDHLVQCNEDGTAEISELCVLGCKPAGLRCTDVDPSNNLAAFLDTAGDQPDLDLGGSATINTNTGEITVGRTALSVRSETMAQPDAPTVRVFIVRSLTAMDVSVIGKNALAFVSDGDVKIEGVFAVSAKARAPGAGAFNDGGCKGSPIVQGINDTYGGASGGGFGSPGGEGGAARNSRGSAFGASGGTVTGTPTLIPLRGGCDGGGGPSNNGAGGGAIQIVSRTQIVVHGVIAANGSTDLNSAGGSGGGILLEAPLVDVAGAVVANGAGGSGGCGCAGSQGEDGQLDVMPAKGGTQCTDGLGTGAAGGDGAAGASVATKGLDVPSTDNQACGGGGGGGVGRIRVNTAPGGQRTSGVYSPAPRGGALATR